MQTHRASLALCTGIMNRLCDLKEVLPYNLEIAARAENVRIYILDFCSDDGVTDWIKTHCSAQLKSGMLQLFQFEGREFYDYSLAKNTIHLQAKEDIVCNMDADNYLEPGFAEFVQDAFAADENVLGIAWKWRPDAPKNYADLPKGFGGRIFMSRKWFVELGGYDERFVGYGAEDKDLISRASEHGLNTLFVPRKFLRTIVTDHEKRVRHIEPVENSRSAEETWMKTLASNEEIYRANLQANVKAVNPDGFGRAPITQIFADE